MRFTRVALASAVSLLILLAGAVATVALFGERLLVAVIEKAGPAVLGRDVHVGRMTIDWGRHTTVTATDLVVADAAWSSRPVMLRVRRAELTLDLLDALRLRLSPVALGLQEPLLHLARGEEGRWNLPRAQGGGASGIGIRSDLAALREAEIEGGELIVDDLASPGVEARIAALSVRMPRAADGVEFQGTASHGGSDPVAFSGRVGSPAQLLHRSDGGNPFPVRLKVGPDTAHLSAEGHVARPLELAGIDLRVEAQGDDLAPLLAALAAVPDTATPPFRLAARVTSGEGAWKLHEIAARMGESEMRGEAALSLGQPERPQLSVDVIASRIAPQDFSWLTSLGHGRQAGSSSPADASLPTAWLRRADAKGNLRVERLEGLGGGPVSLRLGFELKDGRMHVQPLRLELRQGAAEGSATIDVSDGLPPRLALQGEASGLQIEQLLAMFGADEVSGTLTSGSVDLRGRGTTWREVAAALGGRARFRVSDGSIGLASLSHMSMGPFEALGMALGTAGGGSAATPMTCAIADFPVREGVARAERLVVAIPQMVIVGEGTLRLGDATVHLTLTPKPRDEALLRVVVPVVITGDLSSPEVTKNPDLRVGTQSGTVPAPCD